MPPVTKRSRDDIADCIALEHKRFKTTIEESATELVCPITQELPVDPVIAEDGHIYERVAIEEWLARGQRSPATNQKMGCKLLAALQVKNMIGNMVKSGALSGDIAAEWLKKLEEEREVAQTRAAAEGGDVEAMCDLGKWYYSGVHGLKRSASLCFHWFKRAADGGSVRGLGAVGLCYGWGVGCEQSATLAVHYFTRGADLGERWAAYYLADAFANGRHALPRDEQLANKWYRVATEPPACKQGPELSYAKRATALEWLARHNDSAL